MVPDLGTRRMTALRAVIEARRQPTTTTLWERTRQFFQKRDLPRLVGTSLTTLKIQGFTAQDFVEHEIRWRAMPYSIDDAIDFGFTWDHMRTMGFEPLHFKQFEPKHYTQLGVTAKEMMQTSLSVHDLVALKLSPQMLHQLKWSWEELRTIGATRDNIQMPSADQNMYFQQPVVTRSAKRIAF